MHEFLKMPIQASTHAAEIDQMTVLVHWLMLVCSSAGASSSSSCCSASAAGANPKASYTGAKGKIAKGTEVAVAIDRSRPAGRSTRSRRGPSA